MGQVTPAELRNYISTREAADMLGVSPNSVRGWCSRRLIRYLRVGPYGTNIRVHRDDIVGMVRKFEKETR